MSNLKWLHSPTDDSVTNDVKSSFKLKTNQTYFFKDGDFYAICTKALNSKLHSSSSLSASSYSPTYSLPDLRNNNSKAKKGKIYSSCSFRLLFF